MRLVWLIGAPASAKTALEQALTHDRTGILYTVRTAASVAEVPDEHFANPGVIALLDAFSVQHKGFEGVKLLRDRGFKGHVFIFGEPAPEEVSLALTSLGLSGFFPPFERVDWFFVGGVIHASTEYDGSIDVQRFISPGGRCSFETIRSLKDFNAFSAKLAAFVGRFGIDLPKLKKVLMALSLPHVKTDSGSPAIEQPFSIYYGMDPKKIALATQTHSRGAAMDVVRKSYASAVSSIRSEVPLTGAMFPEFIHLTKVTQNLVLLGGSATNTDLHTFDPVLLVTTIPFPPKDATATVRPYFFSFIHVVPAADIVESDGATPAPAASEVLVAATPAPEAPVEDQSPLAAGTLLDSSDLGDLLAEPKLVGDAPTVIAESEPPRISGPKDILSSSDTSASSARAS